MSSAFFIDTAIVALRHRRTVISVPVTFTLIALVISLLITPTYKSAAKLLAPQNSGSTANAMLAQLGGLSGIAANSVGLKSTGDVLVGILESRTIADSLIAEFGLKERYKSRNLDEAREQLAMSSQIVSGKKDGLITITISDKDPKFAADLANAYIEKLIAITAKMALTEASQRRTFFEEQLRQTADALAKAEVVLVKMQEKTGLLHPAGQVQALISAAAELKASIAAKEVELKGIRTFASAKNPDVVRLEEELKGYQDQLAKLERSSLQANRGLTIPVAKLPATSIEHIRHAREVKYYESLYELLAKQYELAKIDEAKDAVVVQVLDKAVPAERKSAPKRVAIVLFGLLLGMLAAAAIVALAEALGRSKTNPAHQERWNNLRRTLHPNNTRRSRAE